MKQKAKTPSRQIAAVVKKGLLKDIDQGKEDYQYWLSRPVQERAAAVTFLISQLLQPGERMDKTFVRKRKLFKDDTGARL